MWERNGEEMSGNIHGLARRPGGLALVGWLYPRRATDGWRPDGAGGLPWRAGDPA